MTTDLNINDDALDGLELEDDLDGFLLTLDHSAPPCGSEAVEDTHLPSKVVRSGPSAWPQAMIIDVALGLDNLEVILDRYGMNQLQWENLQDNLAFRLDLARTSKEISESGLSFKRKAATQAEMYLVDMDSLMSNPDVAPGTKVDIFKTCARLGELEPAKSAESSGTSISGYNIQINF